VLFIITSKAINFYLDRDKVAARDSCYFKRRRVL